MHKYGIPLDLRETGTQNVLDAKLHWLICLNFFLSLSLGVVSLMLKVKLEHLFHVSSIVSCRDKFRLETLLLMPHVQLFVLTRVTTLFSKLIIPNRLISHKQYHILRATQC